MALNILGVILAEMATHRNCSSMILTGPKKIEVKQIR